MAIIQMTDHELQISLQKFNRLRRLATRANVAVLLELFAALRLAEGNVAKIDRLTTAITYVLNYSNLNRSFYMRPFSISALETIMEARPSILREIFDVIDGLPLKWGPGTAYEPYAHLSHNKLIEHFYGLLERPDLKFTLGEYLVIARKYLRICTGLIELTHLKRMKLCLQHRENDTTRWASFVFSEPMLGNLLADYSLIKDELPYLQLPLIEFFKLGTGRYLLSQELVVSSLMTGYVHLKEQVNTYPMGN